MLPMCYYGVMGRVKGVQDKSDEKGEASIYHQPWRWQAVRLLLPKMICDWFSLNLTVGLSPPNSSEAGGNAIPKSYQGL